MVRKKRGSNILPNSSVDERKWKIWSCRWLEDSDDMVSDLQWSLVFFLVQTTTATKIIRGIKLGWDRTSSDAHQYVYVSTLKTHKVKTLPCNSNKPSAVSSNKSFHSSYEGNSSNDQNFRDVRNTIHRPHHWLFKQTISRCDSIKLNIKQQQSLVTHRFWSESCVSNSGLKIVLNVS